MALQISDSDKVNLLFKQFNNVANVRQDVGYQAQLYPFRDNLQNASILNDEIPSTLPVGWRISDLDICSNIIDGDSLDLTMIGFPQLRFYKRLPLSVVQNSNDQTYYNLDSSGNNVLQDTIPFKQDNTAADTYNYILYAKPNPTTYTFVSKNAPGTLYLIDTKTGFLEFYASAAELAAQPAPITPLNPPAFSFFRYVGQKGITGGGGGGGDASFNNVDISGNLIVQNTNIVQSITGLAIPGIPSSLPIIIAILRLNNTSQNVCGHFSIRTNQGPPHQLIEFIAGVQANPPPNPPPSPTLKPYIHILNHVSDPGAPPGNLDFLNELSIAYDNNNPQELYLLAHYPVGVGAGLNEVTVRLTNNGRGWDGTQPIPLNISDWALPSFLPEYLVSVGTTVTDISMSLDNISILSAGEASSLTSLVTGFNSKTLFQDDMYINSKIVPKIIGLDVSGNLNISKHLDVRGNVLVSGETDLCGNLNVSGNVLVSGETDLCGNLNVTEGIITGKGNVREVDYRNYDNVDFSSNSIGTWCTIAERLTNPGGEEFSDAVFNVHDMTSGIKQVLTFSVTSANANQGINVYSNTWSSSYADPKITKIRVYNNDSTDRSLVQLFRKLQSGATPQTTEVTARLFERLAVTSSLAGQNVTQWNLSSIDSDQVLSNYTSTELDITFKLGNNQRNASTNMHQYFSEGLRSGQNIDMGGNNITAISSLVGTSSSTKVIFSSNDLELNCANGGTILFGDPNASNPDIIINPGNPGDIDLNNYDLLQTRNIKGDGNNTIQLLNDNAKILLNTRSDYSSSGIPDLSGIQGFGQNITFKAVGGDTSGGFGGNIMLDTGLGYGGLGSVILRNGLTTSNDITYYQDYLDMSDNQIINIGQLVGSTGTIYSQSDISMNSKTIQDVAGINTSVTKSLSLGNKSISSRIYNNALMRLYRDNTSDISSTFTNFGFYHAGSEGFIVMNNESFRGEIVYRGLSPNTGQQTNSQISTATTYEYFFQLPTTSTGYNTSGTDYYSFRNDYTGVIASAESSPSATKYHLMPFDGTVEAVTLYGFETDADINTVSNWSMDISFGLTIATTDYELVNETLSGTGSSSIMSLNDGLYSVKDKMHANGNQLSQTSGSPIGWFPGGKPINFQKQQRVGFYLHVQGTSGLVTVNHWGNLSAPQQGKMMIKLLVNHLIPWNNPSES